MLSGHRRLHASKKVGLETVCTFVVSATRDEAAVTVVDSNLHREHMLPSEKAFAFKLKYDAMKRQGMRTDLTSSQLETKLRTDEKIGKASDESRAQIQRYIWLTNLIPELLDMMDKSKIAFSVGVELSYLDDQSQYDVLEMCEVNDCTPSYAQAVCMHKLCRDGALDKDGIADIMNEIKANQREKVTIPLDLLKGKIPETFNERQREDFIIKACEYYVRYLRRQRENER